MTRNSLKLLVVSVLGVVLAGCAGKPPEPAAPVAKAAPAVAPAPKSAADDQTNFQGWLAAFRADALKKGLKPETLDAALTNLQPIPRVLELDRKQPEFTMTFDEYLSRIVKPGRVERGKAMIAANHDLLAQVSQRYGVPVEHIAAMWGIESDFGRGMGDYQLVPALATLAFDGRRSAFFRGELMNALTIADKGMAPLEKLKGFWAGAMGQCQFMPSTYLNFAQSWDGSGKPDIWGNTADVLASTANYLNSLGWKADQRWGYAVKLPKKGLSQSLYGLEVRHDLNQWRKFGVVQINGKKLPEGGALYSLIRADSGTNSGGNPGPVYLVGDDFRALMKWNRSTFFALAAGTLADRLAGR